MANGITIFFGHPNLLDRARQRWSKTYFQRDVKETVLLVKTNFY